MLIRDQKGKIIVRSNHVWVQGQDKRPADQDEYFLFASTELEPEGICVGRFETEAKALDVMKCILGTAVAGLAVDLYALSSI